MERFALEPACPKAIQHLHEGCPKLSVSELEQELSLMELTTAIEGFNMDKVLGFDDYSSNCTRPFGPSSAWISRMSSRAVLKTGSYWAAAGKQSSCYYPRKVILVILRTGNQYHSCVLIIKS